MGKKHWIYKAVFFYLCYNLIMLDLLEEKNFFNVGYQFIGGIDEAGRGPLAGPVVAACVVVKSDFDFKNGKLKMVKDSKKLTAKKREELFDIIFTELYEVGIGITDHITIDKINILQASFLAMKKALGALKNKPDFLMIDGNQTIPNLSLKQTAIVKGDEKVFTIAAASIIAKVTRDRIMSDWHEKFPQYDFSHHKGYGTRAHLSALEKYGPCPIHRLSFAPVRDFLKHPVKV
jgi:ribonuclease HII